MVDQGEKPTIVSYGALLSALEKGKLYDEALQVWEHMLKVGVVPNLYAFTIMASIYAGQGRSEMVDSIIRDMVSSGIEPTVVTFNVIISGCARNSMGSIAFEWFHRMKVLNFSPNEITYEMLIEALAKDAKPKLAYELYLRANISLLTLPTVEARIRHYKWEVKYEYKSQDCYKKLVIAINGKTPGPSIIAQQGDTVVVELKNSLLTENVAIHWHGIPQIGTPWSDGTEGVTQGSY
ncbi:protein LOW PHOTOSYNTHETIC EFFICIENCY 1, chloroplastic-like [Macadamia integrifolia]|uniref:protein LOW PHOTOSYNTHETIC EFFICIENCY 1, chloroplastic-like n=1 Tax=Macadamia integrifolia TaxID=60698 RepID=UPI001C527AFE|nr:protein LOW PHOTOSYNTHETIC EFFICIENCY 1, chloroplastic-like [Macadamia integrifolia]